MFCAWCASCLASCYKASHSKDRLNHPPPQCSVAGTCSDSTPYHRDEKHSAELLLSHSRIIVHCVQICVNVHPQFMWNQCQFLTWKRWNMASSKNCPWPSHNHHLQYGLWRWRWCHLSRFRDRPPRCCGIALGKADWLPCCQSCYSERTPITVGRWEKLWGIDIYTL